MSRRRPGFTLLEVVVVVAVLVILSAVLIPSLVGMRGNNGVKAGADAVRARMFDARSRAMDDGIVYRLSMSDDGRSFRVVPDDPSAAEEITATTPAVSTDTSEQLPAGITAKVLAQDGVEATADQTGWIRVATFTPEGTCREDLVEVVVTDVNLPNNPITIRIRGVTGAIRTVKPGGKR